VTGINYCNVGFGSQDKWKAALQKAGLVVREPGEPMDKVEIACLFNPPPGVLDDCKRLKAVQSLGAGVDFLMADETIPKHLPMMRIVDPLMAERMATFCVWAVRGLHVKMM